MYGGGALVEEDTERHWQQFQLGVVTEPAYVVLCTAEQVAASLFDGYDKRREISVANVLLPLHSVPAWPLLGTKSIGAFRFYYCAGNECENPVTHKLRPEYQMTIQFIVGTSEETGRHELGWVPRLMCATCAPLTGGTSAYPLILEAPDTIMQILTRALKHFNDAAPRRKCYICEATLRARRPVGEVPLCDAEECAFVLSQMGVERVRATIFKPLAAQRLINAMHHIQGARTNLIKAMRWSICHNTSGTCFKRGNALLECPTCTRVEYCSNVCMEESAETHRKHCVAYSSMWNLDNARFWTGGYVSRLCRFQGADMSIFCKCPQPNGRGFKDAALRLSKGREFYACAKGKGLGCGFFRWRDHVHDDYEHDSFCVEDGEEEEYLSSE